VTDIPYHFFGENHFCKKKDCPYRLCVAASIQ
jgi:hypothetical protein